MSDESKMSLRYPNRHYIINEVKKKSLSIKCAVIGCGPSGIAAALALSNRGANVTIMDKRSSGGGLMNIIPTDRMDKKHINRLLGKLVHNKVEFKYDCQIDLNNLDELKSQYDYIFIATGTQKPRTLPDNQYKHTVNAIEYLESPGIIAGDVAVMGGGNVAMDCACEAIRRGGKATVYYRNGREKMKCNDREYNHAVKCGVQFVFNATPPTDGHDLVVLAIGTMPDLPPEIENDPRIIIVGDAKLGSTNIAHAMNHAKAIANKIKF